MTDVSPLFEPLTVRGKTFRNRIVMPPMVQVRPITSPEGVAWYGEHAQGGVALVIVEATLVSRFRDEFTIDNLRPLVQAIHDGGALAAIQLFPGRILPDSKERDRAQMPAEVTEEQIDKLLDDYHKAATICAAAGFDGVEPHGAHGYLLNRFFSPEQNTRTDAYGGDPDGRMRLPLEVVSTIRPLLGNDVLLLYRHTPVGPGYGIPDSLALAEALIHAGVDVLDLSPSSHEQPGDHAAPFMGLGVPVIAVGHLDEVERALEVRTEGHADLVAIGRGLIADPAWPRKVQAGQFDAITRCIRCDVECYGNLRKGLPVTCTQWKD